MSSYKICKFCGEYKHDCHCLGAKEIRRLKKDGYCLISEIEGCLIGLRTHRSESPFNGFMISAASLEKLEVIQKVLDRYKKSFPP